MKLALTPHNSTLTIKHPSTDSEFFETDDGKQVQCIIHLVGTSSKEFYQAVNDIAEHSILSDSAVTIASTTADKMLAALIVGWDDTGFFDEPYSTEGALELITTPENLWLKSQLKDYVEDVRNFF